MQHFGRKVIGSKAQRWLASTFRGVGFMYKYLGVFLPLNSFISATYLLLLFSRDQFCNIHTFEASLVVEHSCLLVILIAEAIA